MKTILALLSIFVAALTVQAQAPQGLRYSAFTGASFEASWDAVPGAMSYEVAVGEYDHQSRQMASEPIFILSTPSASILVDGLEPGQFYCFRVRAMQAEGYTKYSALKAVLELPVPENVTATIEGNILYVSWNEVPGAHHYNIMVTDLRGPHPGLSAISPSDVYTTESLSYDIPINGYGYSSYVVGVSAVACGSDGNTIAQSGYAGASVSTSSAAAIEADSQEAVYYDLTGRRVSVPSPCQVVIELRGTTARLILPALK